jgi:exopolyphosphatase/pppGpp-phosphohydrolase
VRVISARDEARLIYLAVRHAMDLRDKPHLIIDIGGGSVEFIVGDSKHAMMLESRKLGAARMSAQFVKSDPIDTRDHDKAKAFLKDIGIAKLTYYADPSAKTFQDLKAVGRAFGMPTTLLVDPHGCEIGSIAGPAEWASKDALKLIGTALGKG